MITPARLREIAERNDNARWPDETNDAIDELREAADEIERLQAIVALLPKDAQGNPLFVGMRRWVSDVDSLGPFQGWETIKQIHSTNEGWHVACKTCDTTPECCWSSIEEAEKARQSNG